MRYLLILFLSVVAVAQNTSVTGQVTDAGGQSWNNGTFSFKYVGPRNVQWSGGTLNPDAKITGLLSASGAIPATLVPDNSTIIPPTTKWELAVCSATLPQSCYTQTITVTGTSQVTSPTPPAILVTIPVTPQPVNPVTLYSDSEITGAWVGFTYYNLVSSAIRACQTFANQTCTSWASFSGVGTLLRTNSPSGTTPNYLVEYDGTVDANGVGKVRTASLSSNGGVGITISGAGVTGTATIQTTLAVSWVCDNQTIQGDLVSASAITGGQCHDGGVSPVAGAFSYGRVAKVNTGPGTVSTIDMLVGSVPGAGSVSGSITPAPRFQDTYYNLPGTASTLAGDAGCTTDGNGNKTCKSLATNSTGVGKIDFTTGPTPTVPAAGNVRQYFDTNSNLNCLAASGNCGVQANVNNILNAQTFSGVDTFAKIQSALSSSSCSSGCMVTDGKADNATIETVAGAITISQTTHLILHGKYQYTGAAIANGLIQIVGGAGATGGSGSELSCEHYPQQLAGLNLNTITPCGIIVNPSTGPMPIVQLQDNNTGINDIFIHDISFVGSSNVSDVIQIRTSGTTAGGAGAIRISHVYFAALSQTSSWSGYAFNIVCSAGAASNAQYGPLFFQLDTIAGPSTQPAICTNAVYSTTTGGINIDPTSGTRCGNPGPIIIDQVQMEGLTGTYGINIKGSFAASIAHSLINVNNLKANGRAIQVNGIGGIAAATIDSNQLDDENCSNNSGVVDIALVSADATRIMNNFDNGATSGAYSRSDHLIDVDNATSGVQIIGNNLTSALNEGTFIGTGATGVLYCGNTWSQGLFGSTSTEFQSPFTNLLGRTCMMFTNAADAYLRMTNSQDTAHIWDNDIDATGNYKIRLNGTPQLTVSNGGNTTVNGFLVNGNAQLLGPTSQFQLNTMLFQNTAPTIAPSGCGGSGATINNANGTAYFNLGVGTTPGTTCTFTMPTATDTWGCFAFDITNPITAGGYYVKETANTTTSVTLTFFSAAGAATAPTASDVIRVTCEGN